jgi:transposase
VDAMRLIISRVEEAMKSGPNRKYTAEFRAAAVEQVIVGRRGLREVARSLEMSDKTLANWVGNTRKGKALVKRALRPPVTDLEAENARLKQENARLRMEKEILKKAAAYFAKESL